MSIASLTMYFQGVCVKVTEGDSFIHWDSLFFFFVSIQFPPTFPRISCRGHYLLPHYCNVVLCVDVWDVSFSILSDIQWTVWCHQTITPPSCTAVFHLCCGSQVVGSVFCDLYKKKKKWWRIFRFTDGNPTDLSVMTCIATPLLVSQRLVQCEQRKAVLLLSNLEFSWFLDTQ